MSKVDRYKSLIRRMIREGVIRSQKDLGIKLGYTNESSFSQIINQKVQEPKDFISRLKAFYPDLDEEWLMTGKVEMLETPRTEPVEEVIPLSAESITDIVPVEIIEEIKEEVKEELVIAESVPILSEDMSTAPDINIRTYIEENGDELERINPSQILKNADLAERVKRVSMLPTFAPEDVVFIRFIKDKAKLIDGGTYYFDLKSLPTMIRKVKMEGGKLRLKAQHPDFGDIVIDRTDIVNVAEIVGLLRLTFTDFYSEVEEARKQKEEQIKHMIDAQNTQVNSFLTQLDKFNERENRLIDMLEKRLEK